MENKIPIPTDNIFKFYAFFGLLIFIFSAGSIIYVTRSTNELVFQAVIELETAKQISNPSAADTAKINLLERRLKVAASDRTFYTIACGVIGGFGSLLIYYGFTKWHKEVQPIQDEIMQLQLKKLRHEVEQLRQTIPPAEKQPQAATSEMKQKGIIAPHKQATHPPIP
jgi:hypothetical protein